MDTDILIVGGGIAGLAAARALAADGHAVVVVERVPTWAPVGAGIVLADNAMRVLEHLGVADRVRRDGRVLPAATIADEQGAPMLDMGESAAVVSIHRADLHEALLADLPAEVRLGTTIDDLAVADGGVIASLRDGSVHRAAVVVGADGIRSRVRQLLLGEDAPAVTSAGQRVWRVVAPGSGAADRAVEQWGRGQRVGVIPLAGSRTYAFLVEEADVPITDADVPALQVRFSGFNGPAGAFLRGLDPDSTVLCHAVEELDRVDFGRGRVALIGDAAHAMTPNLGQGAAQALEDVPALVAAVRAASGDDVAGLLARLRTRRVRAVKARSARVGRVGQVSARGIAALRNVVVRMTPPALARRAAAGITGHDPIIVPASGAGP